MRAFMRRKMVRPRRMVAVVRGACQAGGRALGTVGGRLDMLKARVGLCASVESHAAGSYLRSS